MFPKIPKSIDFLFLKVTLFVEWSVLFNNGVDGMGNITNHDFGELYQNMDLWFCADADSCCMTKIWPWMPCRMFL